MKKEMYKKSNIKGFPNYHVYEDASVLNIKTNTFLKPWLNGGGYLCVSLCNKGKQKSLLLHRLVALAYIPNPLSKELVMHLDDNPRNAHVLNLRWGTPRDNVRDAVIKKRHSGHIGSYMAGKTGDDHPKSKLMNHDKVDVFNKYSTGKYTYKQLACEYNVCCSTIHRIIKNTKLCLDIVA